LFYCPASRRGQPVDVQRHFNPVRPHLRRRNLHRRVPRRPSERAHEHRPGANVVKLFGRNLRIV
jgi:hypothetical protein